MISTKQIAYFSASLVESKVELTQIAKFRVFELDSKDRTLAVSIRESAPRITRNASRITLQHSQPGMVLGTVGYMSPEQARGRTTDIDRRSDIFSFGCILFEAVTGHKAFAGEDAIDTLNKIIRGSPPPITDLRPDASNRLQRIVRRCLAKNPKDRYQTTRDVAIELRELHRELANPAGIDITGAPALIEAATGVHLKGPAPKSAGSSSPPARDSSAEYLISQVKLNKPGAIVTMGLLLLTAALILFWYFAHTRAAVLTMGLLALTLSLIL